MIPLLPSLLPLSRAGVTVDLPLLVMSVRVSWYPAAGEVYSSGTDPSPLGCRLSCAFLFLAEPFLLLVFDLDILRSTYWLDFHYLVECEFIVTSVLCGVCVNEL